MDRVIVSGCVLLVIFGVTLGVSINFQSGASETVKSILDTTAAIATIIAAGVAVYALTLWKSEFRHGKKFEALARLKAAVDSLGVAPRFMRYSMMHGVHSARRRAPESLFLNEALKGAREAWNLAESECLAAIDECEFFIDDSKFRELVILQIELYGLVVGFKDEMLDLMFREEEIDEASIRQQYAIAEKECSFRIEYLHDLVKSLRAGFRK
ncbi:hypothetical protein [Pseudomonas vancouverensis]|uniref:DUF4760 domain-containing protein n=1 Tax=Pseudomonas vancouverensis TaxID=95300 RepID=A0A1H2MVG6_PSEVA|nr:hypothetical protein [Pseudomonas vancouverensis]KAB0489671.1 hypothetical protein F7R09_28540 [Pseudomonas vancouverensis]TDB67167.1 hypothetical protein EIY72_03710 [Pseudomonas vancouverensis]SDU97219.1 hypothetical protein SAMN05216558_1334 [Pseudomonas vancouverensis]